MSISKIPVDEFISLSASIPVLDVRSPGEYEHAHIPGALSFPLFSNDERRIIGTAYKQDSRENAIKIGLASFGKNMVKMVEEAEGLLKDRKEVIVHCWRGGMRSAAVAWLLDLYGFKVFLLTGGYKAYRGWALQQLEKPVPLGIIGGYTGSNKTGMVKLLEKRKEFVVNLEALAGHMGSAFGNLQRDQQPSQEQFENLLAFQLFKFSSKDPEKIIWMEYESQRIGDVNIPSSFYNYFASQPYYFINIPFEERLKHIVSCYGNASKESLINAIVRITRRLGGLEAKKAINFLVDDDIENCFRILLVYYDKLYHKYEDKRKLDKARVTYIESSTTDEKTNLDKLMDHANRKG